MKTKIIWSVVVVIVGIVSFFGGKLSAPQPQIAGALGNNYIERYDSAILYNGGYNSQLPIKTSNTITANDINITTTNTATSSLIAGCVQTYATSTDTAIQLVFGTSYTGTTTLPSGVAGSGGLVAWKFGSCPSF